MEKHPPSHAAEETSSQFVASDRVKGIDPSWRTDPHSTFLSSGRGRSGRGVGGGRGTRAGADKVVISRLRPPSDSNTTRINGAAGCPKQAVEMIKPLVSLTYKRLFIFYSVSS